MSAYGPVIGVCRICGVAGQLTADHVPPKGAPRIGQRVLHDLGLDHAHGRSGRKGKHFQRGVKFPSLCEKCNNVLLGRDCDPALIALAVRVDEHLKSRLDVDALPIDIVPARLGRSIVGHLLASMSEDQILKAPTGQAFRRYFCDWSLPFPREARFVIWPHYSPVQFISTGHALITNDGIALVFTLKFYPLAFILPWEAPASWKLPGIDLTDLVRENSIQPTQILFPVKQLIRLDYPEVPGANDGLMVSMLGQETIRYSVPFARRR
jgi:hypothetical protein